MISKAKAKFIKSLQLKKYRKEEQCFIVEGAKSVEELLYSDFDVQWVAASPSFLEANQQSIRKKNAEPVECSESELSAVSSFQNNNSALAIAKMKPDHKPLLKNELALVLDDIRDPGNLGTIIRTADWYGIRHIIASEETADFYNPKVISSTMGSFCRVQVFYTSLGEYLQQTTLPVYGAFLNGDDIHTIAPPAAALVVIGNESRGISDELKKFIAHPITIPRIGHAESLNAAIATAVILDNMTRLQK